MVDGSTVISDPGSSALCRIGEADVPPPAILKRRSAYPYVKATLEWMIALTMMLVAVPLVACLGILLKCTSEGPVFYSQTRLGRSGRTFRIFKLRTMIHNCEATTGPVWSIAGDSRVTTIGRWLRDTHLDELPQLWNVLRCDMSLIGPRPERPEIAAKIERWLPRFRERLLVRPGITGLAQMRLPADSDIGTVHEKLEHDLQYVRSVSASLDARIAVSTALHFVGWAATAASRRLVERFAPSQVLQLPPIVARPGLSVVGRGISAPDNILERDSLSAAA